MAHEYISLHAALYGYKMANKIAMENWSKVYNGDLGIALTDTFTSDEFLRTFDLKSSKLFDGVRQDSGDPFEYVDKFVKHYQDMKIDPMSKVIGFTNGLNVKTAISIKEYCIGKIKQFFGIGTFFTNDLKKLNIAPLNIVIKLTKVLVDGRWVGAVKLSDDYGKCTGKEDDVKQAKRELNITEITYTHNPAGNENDVAKPTYL
jgi:nicotinate phosphoribosyltransferase